MATTYTTYTVIHGDRWDTISNKVYGSPFYTPDLQLANTEVPLDEDIPAGTVLRIPIKELVQTQTELLPPWKR